VWPQVWSQVRSQVGSQVWSQVGSQVRAQVGSQVRLHFWAQVGALVGSYDSFGTYGNVCDLGLLSFYDLVGRAGVDLGRAKPDFEIFMSLIRSGVYDMIQLDGVCIVCSYPESIYRDTLNNLHADRTPAIRWADGYELFYLHGVHFPKDLWEKV